MERSYKEVRDDYFRANTVYLCQKNKLKIMQDELNKQIDMVERLEKERAEKYDAYLKMKGRIDIDKLRDTLIAYVENNDDLSIFADIIIDGIKRMSTDQLISLANAVDSFNFDQLMG